MTERKNPKEWCFQYVKAFPALSVKTLFGLLRPTIILRFQGDGNPIASYDCLTLAPTDFYLIFPKKHRKNCECCPVSQF